MLDPFAGVGGTLLGRGDRARPAAGASASSWTRAGRPCTRETVAALRAERDGAGPGSPTSAPTTRAASRGFDPSGSELRLGDARALLPTLDADSRSTSSPPTRRTTSSCR